MSLRHYALLGWLCALALAPAHAAAPPAGGVRLDREGEPLPEGAFARLGTARFRASPKSSVQLSPDGQTIAVIEPDGLRFLDARTGKELCRIEDGVDFFSIGAFCQASKAFAVVVRDRTTIRWYAPRSGRLMREVVLKDFRALDLAFSGHVGVLAVVVKDTVTYNITIEVFDRSGKHLRRFRQLQEVIIDVGLSVNDRCLVCCSDSLGGLGDKKTIQVWDVSTGKELGRFGPGAKVSCAALSPDGKLLALLTTEGAVQLWSLERGKRLHTWQARPSPRYRLSFSPDGSLLLVADVKGVLGWRVNSGERLRLLPGRRTEVLSFQWRADGKVLACGADGSGLAVWEALGGKACFPEGGHRAAVDGLAFSHDGKRVISVDAAGKALEWDQTGKPARYLRRGGPAPRAGDDFWDTFRIPPVLSPGGEHLLGEGSHLKRRELRKVDGGPVLWSFRFRVVAFSQDGALLAAIAPPTGQAFLAKVDKGSRASIVRSRTGEEAASFFLGDRYLEDHVVGVTFTADGKRLVVATLQDEEQGVEVALALWDIGKRARVGSFRPSPISSRVAVAFRLSCSPRGDLVARTTLEGVELLSLRTGAVVRRIPLSVEHVSFVGFSPDGRSLAIATPPEEPSPARLALYEVWTGKKRWEMPATGSEVTSLTFSPDGRVIATGHADGTILLWDVTGKRLA
jgi:WD40 repeat protein